MLALIIPHSLRLLPHGGEGPAVRPAPVDGRGGDGGGAEEGGVVVAVGGVAVAVGGLEKGQSKGTKARLFFGELT